MTLEAQGVVPLGRILAIMRFFSCASGSGGANVILVDTCRLGVGWRAARPSFAGTRVRYDQLDEDVTAGRVTAIHRGAPRDGSRTSDSARG